MPASTYERELKGILEADVDTLKKVIKKCDAESSRKYLAIEKKPFLVVRAAGSLGFDLLAVRSDISLPIEVKSSSSGIVPFTSNSAREVKQAELFKLRCDRAGLFPLYALRLKNAKNDVWRVFTLDIEVSMDVEWIYREIPVIDQTKSHNYILKWEKGKPLSDFIELICQKR
ncbi:MAG: Holliday junction resolvase [Candidatus Thermoplasmatota archaeon]|nr:Holliday junction resolvase [Candidatus Thermoplasmatota archaeon]